MLTVSRSLDQVLTNGGATSSAEPPAGGLLASAVAASHSCAPGQAMAALAAGMGDALSRAVWTLEGKTLRALQAVLHEGAELLGRDGSLQAVVYVHKHAPL